MILQSSYLVVDCPVCGRTLEMQLQLISHEIACSHCLGKFTVYEANDGSLATATNLKGADLLKRAEQLLRATGAYERTEQPAKRNAVEVADGQRHTRRCPHPGFAARQIQAHN